MLTTTDAALPDAFTNASVAASMNPLADATTAAAGAPTGSPKAQPGTQPATSAAKTRFVPAMPGVTVADTTTDSPAGATTGGTASGGAASGGAAGIGGGVSITASITLNIEVNTGPIKIEGAVTVTPTVGFELNLSTNAIGIPNGLRVSQTARVAAQTQITTTVNGEKKIKIGEIPGAPIPIGPVVIQPKIPIYLVIAGTASITTTTGMAIGATLGWDSRNPAVLTGKNLSTAPTMTGAPDPGSVTVGGSIGLAAEPAMTLYGIAGPFIAAQLDLKAEGTPNPSPGQPYFTLTPQLSFNLGLKLDLFGTDADVSLTLATITFAAFTITTAPTATYTITPPSPAVSPGNTVQLAATRTDSGTARQTWTLTGGTTRDKVTTTGLFTAGPSAGRTLTVSVRDTSGATGQTRIIIGTPLDPPANPQAVANTGGSAYVGWTPPGNTGGSPLKSYTVLTTPDTGTHTVPAGTTSTTIPGVSAGAYVAIYATNTAGARSRAASALVVADPAGHDRPQVNYPTVVNAQWNQPAPAGASLYTTSSGAVLSGECSRSSAAQGNQAAYGSQLVASDGKLLWRRDDMSLLSCNGSIVRGDGSSVMLAGMSDGIHVRAFSSSGEPLWTSPVLQQRIDRQGYAMPAVGKFGEVYLSAMDGWGHAYLIVVNGSDGALIKVQSSGPDLAIAPTSVGVVNTVDYYGTVRRFARDGTPIDESTQQAPLGVSDVAVAPDGSFVLSGPRRVGNNLDGCAPGDFQRVARFNASAEITWTHDFPVPLSSRGCNNSPRITAMPDGRAVVTLLSEQDDLIDTVQILNQDGSTGAHWDYMPVGHSRSVQSVSCDSSGLLSVLYWKGDQEVGQDNFSAVVDTLSSSSDLVARTAFRALPADGSSYMPIPVVMTTTFDRVIVRLDARDYSANVTDSIAALAVPGLRLPYQVNR